MRPIACQAANAAFLSDLCGNRLVRAPVSGEFSRVSIDHCTVGRCIGLRLHLLAETLESQTDRKPNRTIYDFTIVGLDMTRICRRNRASTGLLINPRCIKSFGRTVGLDPYQVLGIKLHLGPSPSTTGTVQMIDLRAVLFNRPPGITLLQRSCNVKDRFCYAVSSKARNHFPVSSHVRSPYRTRLTKQIHHRTIYLLGSRFSFE